MKREAPLLSPADLLDRCKFNMWLTGHNVLLQGNKMSLAKGEEGVCRPNLNTPDS